ncbi:hypothetical protein CANCADRAFT_43149 [Tortispora caseinolytica NRRL Y-17796]|uniref:Aldehyde dehydrogenase 5, mitochondrial n=1 Tax=Tortispora caseinolytica NRRL Y-17796 TaxID=767744 RepID=A0A1E4TLM3_9ASCO|nr:hypothetical protein CANCADRAFT_43149 [Tortispora caseinolytica NRRL Y-17796]
MSLSETLKFPNGIEVNQPTGLFINNEFVPSKEGAKFDVFNPSTGKKLLEVYEAREADIDAAVDAAEAAFHGVWSKFSAGERGACLLKLADLMEKNLMELASIETANNGKAIALAKGDVAMSIQTLRYYAGWSDKIHGKVIETDNNATFNYTRQEPIGVCGQIIPWNFPLLMWAWKIAPAICTGNTVVLKTAENTPLSAYYACTLIAEAGFPAGVINVVTGYGKTAGAAIASHMRIHKVAFTGSTLVGRAIMKAAAASNLKKVTLELGGKSPNIIFDDADIDKAVEWVNFGIFFNGGEVCCAGSRVYVQEGIYDKVVEAFKKRAIMNKVGDPFDENTFQGAQVSKQQFERIMGYVEAGKKAGATVEVGGNRVGTEGWFVEPTIFSNVSEDMQIVREEIFGPVCTIAKFKDVDDVVAKANNTSYGLAAGVHTSNLKTALEVAHRIRAGSLWVNQYNALNHALPFGGYNESGIGRELGKEALRNYTQIKTVSVNLQ